MKILVSVATSELQACRADVRAVISLWLDGITKPDPHFIFPNHEALEQFIAFLSDSAKTFAQEKESAE